MIYAAIAIIAFVAGCVAGIQHERDSICQTIDRLGYRTIDDNTRIVGKLQLFIDGIWQDLKKWEDRKK